MPLLIKHTTAVYSTLFVNLANEATIETASSVEPHNTVVHGLPLFPAGLTPRQSFLLHVLSAVLDLPSLLPGCVSLEEFGAEDFESVWVAPVTEICEAFLAGQSALLEDASSVDEVVEEG